jgi:hypothetical protein
MMTLFEYFPPRAKIRHLHVPVPASDPNQSFITQRIWAVGSVYSSRNLVLDRGAWGVESPE